MKRRCWALAALLTAIAAPASAQDFSFLPAGDLEADSGMGLMDDTVFAPDMRFPIESAPAYANSQVWGHGGYYGPGGGQCDIENFSYPWRDNFCETRSWDMPLCPAGTGHQGQDIRAASCDNNTHWAVATVDGTITNIGSYSVYLTAEDGTRYDYLHMSNVQVQLGQQVSRGEQLGMVSNVFGGTATTIHLHFNIRQNIDTIGDVFVSPYMSLVWAYAKLLDAPPQGELDELSCDMLGGWAFDGDAPNDAVTVALAFAKSGAEQLEMLGAAKHRDDLCDSLGSCEHSFRMPAPLSLFDDTVYDVGATAPYDILGEAIQLGQSPRTMQCPPIVVAGTLRALADDSFVAFGLSDFWDQAVADANEVDAVDVGSAWPDEPDLVTDGAELWLVDDGVRRLLTDADVVDAWRFDVARAQTMAASELDALPIGAPLPARPVVVRGGDGNLHLLDLDGSGQSSSVSSGGASPPPVVDEDGDCGCETPGKRTADGRWWLTTLLALALIRRRSLRRSLGRSGRQGAIA